MSTRLPVLGGAATRSAAAGASGPRGARIHVERRAVTVCARDGRAEPFARALAEGLRARGLPVVLVDGGAGQGSGSAAAALAEALATPGALVVVSHRALAIELEGVLDVWIGLPPLPAASQLELAAHRSCQLELRASAEPVARLLAAELAGVCLVVPAPL